jgi:HAD superfamily hydrolase (TIGR01490 family)
MATAAFFDLDLTLIDVNSGLLWARHERRLGNISLWQMSRAILWHGLYRLAVIDIETALEHALGHYRGIASSLLDSRTREWFRSEVEHRLRPAALSAIAEHKAAGHPLVLLTNSSCYQAAIAAETWGLDGYLANQFPVDERGCLTGTFERPACYGPGKVARAETWAAERGVDLARSYFYTDSFSDLPMLERVGEPRVVSPDPRLRRAARQRGWAILDW